MWGSGSNTQVAGVHEYYVFINNNNSYTNLQRNISTTNKQIITHINIG